MSSPIVKSKWLKVRFGCPTGSHFGRAVSQPNIFFCKNKFFWNQLRNIFHLIKKFPRLSGRPEIRICQEKSIDGAPKWRWFWWWFLALKLVRILLFNFTKTWKNSLFTHILVPGLLTLKLSKVTIMWHKSCRCEKIDVRHYYWLKWPFVNSTYLQLYVHIEL